MIVSLDTVRSMALERQGLFRRSDATGKEAMLRTIRHIGMLQLDTVNVVARSHYLVMLSRLGVYRRSDLDALLYPDRDLVEQWAHAACLLPAEDYRNLLPAILERRGRPISKWQTAALGPEPETLLDQVMDEIRERGALSSRDFEDPRDASEPWWGFKPAKHALVHQFRLGHLMVDRRVNFQIFYDLPERVMSNHGDLPPASLDQYHRWAVVRGLECLGVATARHVADYYRLNIGVTRQLMKRLQEDGEIVPVEVPGWQETAYVHRHSVPDVERSERREEPADVTAFLSPFDNLIWDRKRVKLLFDFDYTVEIYVPTAKRVYGYYVMPILHQGRLVGRIDPKADRQNGILLIRHLYLEPGEPVDAGLMRGLSAALREFMAFHRLGSIRIEDTDPAELKPALTQRLSEVIVE